MRTFLLVAHVAAAILFVGPATVATSLFPRYAVPESAAVARALNRISRVYGVCSLAVPAVGLALVGQGGWDASQPWIAASLAIFLAATALLLAVILPAQRRMLGAVDDDSGADVASTRAVLRAASGVYGLAWIVVLSLMVAKPG